MANTHTNARTHTQPGALSPTLKRVASLRGRLLLDQPFFGMLALRLLLVEDNAPDVTAWTDGRSMGFSPAFVATLTDDQVVGLIAHEVMHCACGHPWRRDAREHEQWNIAADHAINHVLRESGFTLPDGALADDAFKGRNAEWIYDRLPAPQNRPQSGNGNGQDNGQGNAGAPGSGQSGATGAGSGAPSGGDVRDAPADCADDGNTAADWQEATAQAAKLSRGSLPGSAREALTAAAHTAVDWRSLLQRYLTEIVAADYAWSRPNARYMTAGVYLPALRTPQCGALVVALDTSASVDSVLLQQFMGEIRELARTMQPTTVHVMQCDTRVHHTDCFDRGDDVVIGDVFGRGGTDFAPVFEALDRDGIEPAALVYLTDLDGPFPATSPVYPVLWCVYGANAREDAPVPFGDVIPCE
jgi:predicted metal-dependent peptidase